MGALGPLISDQCCQEVQGPSSPSFLQVAPCVLPQGSKHLIQSKMSFLIPSRDNAISTAIR